MGILPILFDKSHFTSPFTIPKKEDQKSIQLTTIEKTACIALSLLIGFYTAGVGGVIIFYITTAAIKVLKLNNQSDLPSNQPPPTSPPSDFPQDQRTDSTNFYTEADIIKDHSTDETSSKKYIIKQNEWAGARGAVAEMLTIDISYTFSPNLPLPEEKGDTACIEYHMNFERVPPLVTELKSKDFLMPILQKLIAENGPAIVSINHNDRKHFIIVDEIISTPSDLLDPPSIRLRDPLPGKDLTIQLAAFSKVFEGGDVIQAKKKTT